jgi:hypothetical protein
VKSVPLRVTSRTPTGPRRARVRIPSRFTSCSQPGPEGGALAGEGRHGSIIPSRDGYAHATTCQQDKPDLLLLRLWEQLVPVGCSSGGSGIGMEKIMTKSVRIGLAAALLLGGATFAMAQNGPATGGYPPARWNPNLYGYHGYYNYYARPYYRHHHYYHWRGWR